MLKKITRAGLCTANCNFLILQDNYINISVAKWVHFSHDIYHASIDLQVTNWHVIKSYI